MYIIYTCIVLFLCRAIYEYLNAPDVKIGSVWISGDTLVRVIGVSKYLVKYEYLDTREIHVYNIFLFKIFAKCYKNGN